MALRKDIRSKTQYQVAYELEKAGDNIGAIKGYEKASRTDPTNIQAWNRQMILFRKSKSKLQEISLIKTAISQYKKSITEAHKEWLDENKEKAASSLELATVLGLIEPDGMPVTEHLILEKWETRLYLLEYRLKNARPKKAESAKKSVRVKVSKKIEPVSIKVKPKKSIDVKVKKNREIQASKINK